MTTPLFNQHGSSASEPHRARFRINVKLVLLIAAAVLLVALVSNKPRWGNGDDASRLLSSESGYKAAVDVLAQRGMFQVRKLPRAPQADRLIVEFSPQAAGDPVQDLGDCRFWYQKLPQLGFLERKPGADCAKRLEAYRRRTYLNEDMPRIEQWNISGVSIQGLNAAARVLASSGGPRRIWQGTIKYRAEPAIPGSAYRPGEATLLFSEVGSNRTFFQFLDGAGSPPPLLIRDALRPEAVAGQGSALLLALAPRQRDSIFGSPQITLKRLGRAILIGLPPNLGQVKVYIDGRLSSREPQGGADRDDTDFLIIHPGQFLAIEDAGTGLRRTMQLVETPASISEFGGGRRLREASLYDVSQWLEQADVSGEFDSTIMASLHHDLQRRLAAAMAFRAAPGPPGLSYRGAVLLIDGLTGEIAAAATYPTKVEQLSPADRGDVNRLAWLRTNMNFQPLTIGSAAKVPFAAAIVERRPALLAKTLPYRLRFDSIGRFRLRDARGASRVMKNAPPGPGRGGRVDFRSFLADSNNEFALSLMQDATLAEIDGHPEGNWRTSHAWPANLWKFACVIPYALRSDAPDEGWRDQFAGCSPYLWRDSNDLASGRRPTATPWLKLRMGLVSNDYNDFYLDTIGGGRSLWTTVNLGQAYARILSGRAMSPRLLQVGPGYAAPTLPINLQTWTAITDGMRQVLVDGTAHAVGARLFSPAGRVPAGVYFFAKTGTSDVELPGRDTETGHLIVVAAVRTVSGQAPARPQDICGLKIMVINLQRERSSHLDLAEELLDPTRDPSYLNWLTQPCAPGGRP